mgnify:CR=1 FL=1
MAKLSIFKEKTWASIIDKTAASYGYRQTAHSLVDTTGVDTAEPGNTSAEYRFTLTNTTNKDACELVISVEEIEGLPKRDNFYCFYAGPIVSPGALFIMRVPVTITIDEFYILIDNIMLALLCYIVYARIDTEMTTNIERLTRDIKDKKDLSGYTGVNVYDRVVALFKQGVHRPESTQK